MNDRSDQGEPADHPDADDADLYFAFPVARVAVVDPAEWAGFEQRAAELRLRINSVRPTSDGARTIEEAAHRLAANGADGGEEIARELRYALGQVPPERADAAWIREFHQRVPLHLLENTIDEVAADAALASANKPKELSVNEPKPVDWDSEIASLPAEHDGKYERPSPRSDTMNVERFVEVAGSDVRHVVERKKWIAWTGSRWQVDSGRALDLTRKIAPAIRREAAGVKDKEERDRLWEWAARSESKSLRVAALALAAVDPALVIRNEQLDADPMLLGVRNGVVDLKTGDLRPHAREDYITRVAPVDYQDAAAPRWNAFLARILPDPAVRSFTQRLAGYSLSGSVGEEVVAFLHGSGANGKSRFLGAMLDMLGRDLAYTAPSELIAMQKHGRGHPCDVAALHGKRFVVCNELDQGLRLDEARLKSLSGGDQLTARGMHEDFWSFEPRFKLWIAGNHRPRVVGTDEGVWRRLLLLPFAVEIPPEERDRHLAKKLRAELSGILRWCIDGCLLWQRDGLTPPDAVRVASESYRRGEDRIADFLADRCQLFKGASAPAKLLHDNYVHWCGEVGEEAIGATLFGRMMIERGFERVHTNTGRVYRGLKLLGVVYDDPRGGAP